MIKKFGRLSAVKAARHRAVWREFRHNRAAVLGVIILCFMVLMALLAPIVAPYDPILDLDFDRTLLPVGAKGHLLGTDDYGRDITSRLIYGSRLSLQVGIIVVGMAGSIGTVLGLMAGYVGGWTDTLIMRIVDIAYSFPFFILAIAITAVLGPSSQNAMIALAVISWVPYARLVRGEALAVKQREYVQAARAVGVSTFRIIFRHVLPNCLAPVIIQSTLGVGGAILAATSPSFLGLGAQPPTPEWGAMLSEGKNFLRLAPHLTMVPGLAIALTVLSLNLIGDGLRDALDPRLRR
jgi:peptide/nickel transport system permease protein